MKMAARCLISSVKVLLILSFLASCNAKMKVEKRDLVVPATLQGNWTSQGCYTDVGRTLTGPNYNNGTSMTNEICIAYCDNQGFIYAGTEYTYECFCGNSIAIGATNATATDCQAPCSGNGSEPCGGSDHLNLFWSGLPGPQINPGVGLWSYIGCYTEGKTGRILTNQVPTLSGASNMTIKLCCSACQAAGYDLAGAEYAQECWCGNSLSNGGTLATDNACTSQCSGNKTELCGGVNRVSVYNFNKTLNSSSPTGTSPATLNPSIIPTIGFYNYYGCQTESTSGRALHDKQIVADTMTLESCAESCAGYRFFGTEYGRECYCGNSFSVGSVAAQDSDCSFTCAANSSEFCGAGNRLSTYQLNGTTSPASSPTPKPSPSPLVLPPGWSAQGCWVDGVKGRILTYQQADNAALTIEGCISTCSSQPGNYTIAGLEYGVQCFCDTMIRNGGTSTFSSECTFLCSGNSDETCGAGNRLSIYSIGTPTVLPVPAVQIRYLPGDWE